MQQVELLKNIAYNVASKGGADIIDVLHKKKNVNEFLISKKLDLTINQTRNILYRLSDYGLVRFIRKKDKRKGGWYTYFWTLNVDKSLELLDKRLKDHIDRLEEDLERRKNNRFYYSPEAQLEYSEEEALEHNFICPETGEVLELMDNTELVRQLENEISRLKDLRDQVVKEVENVEKKKSRARQRKLSIEKKKKEEERARKKAKRAREKAKEEKKKGKSVKGKTPKKKTGKTKKKKSKVKKKSVKKAVKKKAKKKKK